MEMSFVTHHYHGIASSVRMASMFSQKPLHCAKSPSASCWTNIILYRWNFNLSCKMRYSEWRDIPKANAWRHSRMSGTSKNRPSHCVNVFRGPYWTEKARWFPLHDRSGSSKCFNPSEYSVSIWNCTSTLNIELSMEKTDSNYGITVSKKLLDGKHTMLYIPMRHGYWNCIVWAVRRLMPNVINPTLAEY